MNEASEPENSRVGHRYDSALAGWSSLRAAVMRAVKIESAVAMGMHAGHFLWDMRKFYDSVDLIILGTRAHEPFIHS